MSTLKLQNFLWCYFQTVVSLGIVIRELWLWGLRRKASCATSAEAPVALGLRDEVSQKLQKQFADIVCIFWPQIRSKFETVWLNDAPIFDHSVSQWGISDILRGGLAPKPTPDATTTSRPHKPHPIPQCETSKFVSTFPRLRRCFVNGRRCESLQTALYRATWL